MLHIHICPHFRVTTCAVITLRAPQVLHSKPTRAQWFRAKGTSHNFYNIFQQLPPSGRRWLRQESLQGCSAVYTVGILKEAVLDGTLRHQGACTRFVRKTRLSTRDKTNAKQRLHHQCAEKRRLLQQAWRETRTVGL